MRKTAAFAAALAVMLPLFAGAQEVTFLPQPAFSDLLGRALAEVAPADAFAVPACRVIDASFLQPVSLESAKKILIPCLSAVSTHYGTDVRVTVGTLSEEGEFTAQVETLLLTVPDGYPVTSLLMRDLSHGLALRHGRLLGHPVMLQRRDPEVSAQEANPAQEALAACMLPMVMRRIQSGADFIRYYGGCLRQDRRLAVVALKPWAGHPMGVVVMSSAPRPVVESLSTTVSVPARGGRVTVDLVGHPVLVYRP